MKIQQNLFLRLSVCVWHLIMGISVLFAHDLSYYNNLQGDEIALGKTLSIEDGYWDGIQNTSPALFDIDNSFGVVRLRYDYKSSEVFFTNTPAATLINTLKVKLRIRYWTSPQGPGAFTPLSQTTTVWLEIDNDGRIHDQVKIPDARRMVIFIEDIQGLMEQYHDIFKSGVHLFLESEIHCQQLFRINDTDPQAINYPDPTNYNLDLALEPGKTNLAKFSWSYIFGAEYYELEWVVIDDPVTDNGTRRVTSNLSLWDADFRRASRLQIKDTEYKLSLLYPESVIAYRIRPVYLSGSNGEPGTYYGPWSTSEVQAGDLIPLGNTSTTNGYYFLFNGFELARNWQFARSYAEWGISKEVISFADPTLRTRQTVTRLHDEEAVMVAEQVYDFHGRSAVSILPHPVNEAEVRFFEGLHQVQGIGGNPEPFTASHFDVTKQVGGLSTAFYQPALDQSAGAAKYYSSQNEIFNSSDARKSRLYHQHGIPDAQGFVYTRTHYMDDPTGRVRMQSGIGAAHQTLDPEENDARQTQIYYAGTNEAELYRLFGKEVGNPAHYQKELSIDPNGQISVAYKDQTGRIIATALAGNAPESLDEIPHTPAILQGYLPLASPANTRGNTHASVTSVSVSSLGTTYTFKYDLQHVANAFAQCSTTYCTDCAYEVRFSLTNPLGRKVEIKNPSIIAGNSTYSCINDPLLGYCTEFVVNYPASSGTNGSCAGQNDEVSFQMDPGLVGDYTLTREIRLKDEPFTSQKALLEAQLDNNCIPDLNFIELNSCNSACLEGAYSHFNNGVIPTDMEAIADWLAGLTDPELQSVNIWIRENCLDQTDPGSLANGANPVTTLNDDLICHNLRQTLEIDVLPRGQYFLDQNWASSTINILKNAYISQYGNFGAGAEIDYSSVSSFEATFDQASTPQQDWWRNELIKRHPEYCHYELMCESLGPGNINPYNESLRFDSYLRNIRQSNFPGQAFTSITVPDFITANNSTAKLDIQNPILPYGTTISNSYPPVTLTPAGNTGPGWNIAELDPFYQITGDPITPYALPATYITPPSSAVISPTSLNNFLANYPPSNPSSPPITIVNYIEDLIFQQNAGPTPNQTIDTWEEWEMLVGLYIQQKHEYIEKTWIQDAGCPYYSNLGYPPATVPSYSSLSTMAKTNGKQIRVRGLATEVASLTNSTPPANAPTNCEQYCGAFAHEWRADLERCLEIDADGTFLFSYTFAGHEIDLQSASPAKPVFIASRNLLEWLFDGGTHNNITYKGLLDLCAESCSASQSYSPVGNPTSTPCFNLNDVETAFQAIFQLFDLQAEINSVPPGVIGSPAPTYFELFMTCLDLPTCSRIPYWCDCERFDLNAYVGVTEEDRLQEFCRTFGIDPITKVPEDWYNPVTSTSVAIDATMLLSWYDKCQDEDGLNGVGPLYIDELPFELVNCPEEFQDENPCQDFGNEIRTQNQLVYKNREKARILRGFENQYIAHCWSLDESLSVEYELDEYHYTLYYYDQAGSLVQTVPPAGVDVLSLTLIDLESINSWKNGQTPLPSIEPRLTPKHVQVTRYNYNSYGEIVGKFTPDDGLTTYLYDQLGRPRFSQDAKQVTYATPAYNYTKYDELGRAVEMGEWVPNTGEDPTLHLNGADAEIYPGIGNGTRFDVSLTQYGNNRSGSFGLIDGYIPGEATENMRNRIGSTARIKLFTDGGSYEYEYSTHYVYDISGNVRSIVHLDHQLLRWLYAYPLGTAPKINQHNLLVRDQAVKRIDYEYDLISGNVNEVHYQPGKLDRFYHKYRYDADNRLRDVYTSEDHCYWEHDARYIYYVHGPLARVELGQDLVQGCDYFYTIHGWLKGVNTAELDAARDLGRDGFGALPSGAPANQNECFATDAFGYQLNYFANATTNGISTPDYQAIAATASQATYWQTPLVPTASGYLSAALLGVPSSPSNPSHELFNGNISAMILGNYMPNTSGVLEKDLIGHVYVYDQLQRIKRDNVFSDYDRPSRTWQGVQGYPMPIQDYWTQYSYDPNGNLQTLSRRGNTPNASPTFDMDNLTYNYATAVNPHDPNTSYQTNKLLSVDEDPAIANSAYENDFDGGTYDYEYDEIGQLTKDLDEEILNIEWDAYHKITKIDFVYKYSGTDSTDKPDYIEFRYDPTGNRISKEVNYHAPAYKRDYTYYVRDAQGNLFATYDFKENFTQNQHGGGLGSIKQGELFLYGAKRLGGWNPVQRSPLLTFVNDDDSHDVENVSGATLPLGPIQAHTRVVGFKQYELTEHRANVMSVVSDRKFLVVNTTGGPGRLSHQITGYKSDIIHTSDYYPFGSTMPGRKFNADTYRFGFQGQETDDEVYGAENAVSYKYRVHDARIGRFLSIDPLAPDYPWNSPYAFSENQLINAIELEGLEKFEIYERWDMQTAKALFPDDLDAQEQYIMDVREARVAGMAAGIAANLAWATASRGALWGLRNPVGAEEAIRGGVEAAFDVDMGLASWNDVREYSAKMVVLEAKKSTWLVRTWRKIKNGFKNLLPRRKGNNQTAEVAKSFMKGHGLSDTRIAQHLEAIHPQSNTRLVNLDVGDFVYRYEVVGNPRLDLARKHGLNMPEYFLPDPNINPTTVGLYNASGRKLLKYRVTTATTVLESQANDSGQMGGTQWFSPELHRNLEIID